MATKFRMNFVDGSSREVVSNTLNMYLRCNEPEAIKSIERLAEPYEALPETISNRPYFCAEISYLVKNKGEKIVAITIVKSVTGWGLKEARDWVDSL